MWRLLGLTLVACLGVGCFQDSTQQHSPFLPLNYQSTFQAVRSCRLNVSHTNQYQQVFANSIAADPYTSGTYPLPAGSVVVAEEHGSDPFCNNLIGYYLMAKEQPGYASTAGDWHWQELDSNQRIGQDGQLGTCASCHAKAPCLDYLCSPP
jgi:glucose/arabinose dehydrogenase